MFEHNVEITLKCVKCGLEDTITQYFCNDIKDDKQALEYEFGTKEQHKDKRFWECDCGASMYILKGGYEDERKS